MTFVCTLFRPPNYLPEWSDVYDASWADKLYRGIARNYSKPFRFVCLNDGGYTFAENVISIPLLDSAGWGNMLEAFRPEISDDCITVLGLDTVITGDITSIVDTDTVCGLPRSPGMRVAKNEICNAIGIYGREYATGLWETYQSDPEYWQRTALLGGQFSEVAFLRQNVKEDVTLLDDLYPKQIISYKAHLRRQRNRDRRRALRKSARIMYFHGRPKPPDVEPWLLQHWI
jgi:hypothetical protein